MLEQILRGDVVQEIKSMTAWMDNVPWSRKVMAWSLASRGYSKRMPKVVLYEKAMQLMEDATELRFEPDVVAVSKPALKKQKTATQRACRYVACRVLCRILIHVRICGCVTYSICLCWMLSKRSAGICV